MPDDTITLDEFVLTFAVLASTPPDDLKRAERALGGRRFAERLRAAVERTLRDAPALGPVRVDVSR